MPEYVLHERLRNFFDDTDKSQEEFAAMVGISRSTLANYLANKSDMTTKVLFEICSTMHLSADYLLGLSDAKNVSLDGLDSEQTAIIVQAIRAYEKANNKKPEK